ncbi:MAG: transglycosylase domain-containing protein [Sediminibacterium sp.]|nr:transglycosylase domain-containing protein [Sediminibacterium sp.]
MSKPVRVFWRIFFWSMGGLGLFLLMINFGWLGSMPSIDDIENPTASLASQVYAQDGTLMGKFYLEDRINVQYKDISKHVVNALVATEDERFYDHKGIDPRSLGRALFFLGSEGGASTITMQTAKNLFTNNWSTSNILLRMIQKIKESLIAIKLERNFTKEEIITLYLNTVAFGDNVFGIRNAAKTFFQKEPDRLNVQESAVLIGMLKGATLYNPRRNPKLALDRRNTVLSQMVRNNYLPEAEAAKLKLTPIELNYKKLDESAGLGPYFRMILGEELKKWCKENTKQNGDNYNLYRDGLKIYTTINPRMQQYAEEAVGKHMNYLQKIFNTQANIKDGSIWKGYENVLQNAMKQSDRWRNLQNEGLDEEEIKKTFSEKVNMRIFTWNDAREKDTVMTPYDSIKYHRQMLQAGFMVMDPLTGEVKAWVGGIGFKSFKYDHVNINTKRQVGSTMKPLLYSLAIEEAGFTPNTTVYDQQQSFGSYGLVPATGKSCTGQSMPMAAALAQSRNCASAYILKQLDTEGNNSAKRLVEFLKRSDITANIDPYPSIALGACEISLFEMMQSYSMFPGKGFNVKPMYITRIEDRNGNVLATFTPKRKEIISEVTAYSVAKMMEGVMRAGTGRGMWSYVPDMAIAGKTGTTNENSDGWFIGYTPQLIAGGWVGADDRFIHFNKESAWGQGGRAVLPIWGYFFGKAAADANCGIDTKLTFSKADMVENEIMLDYLNNTPPVLGAESEDLGTGTEGDYAVPLDIKAEDIAPESQKATDTKPTTDPKPADPKKQTPPPPAVITKPIDKPQDKPADKPKAVLPKKGGTK